MVHDITERIKAEKALNESEKKYRDIIELANEGIMIADTSGRINFVNAKMAEMLGYSPEELIGTDATSFVDKNDLELGQQKIENRKKGIQESYEIRYTRKSGEELWCLISATPMYDNNGLHIGNMTMQADITERKLAEEALIDSEKKYSSIVETANEGIMIGNPSGIITYVNPKMEEMLGYSKEELLGTDGLFLIDKNELKIATKQIEDRKIGIKEEYERKFIRKNGEEIWTIVSATPMQDTNGIQTGNLSMITDITKLKIAMDGLMRSNQELERFAYVSSHDLQEPLRMVTLYSQLLEKRYKDSLDSDADDFIEYIVDNAKRMKYLIDDLLEYSRVTSQTREFENIDLEKVLENILSNLSILIIENNVDVTHDPLPTIFADKNQMMQVLENLITNAIKFRGEKPPKIDISAKKGKKEWIFSVKDNGIGISPKHQEQIFEVFKRLHTREEYPGTGIGLSIVQKIIERHGGRIWLESELGKGSTFYFTIPTT